MSQTSLLSTRKETKSRRLRLEPSPRKRTWKRFVLQTTKSWPWQLGSSEQEKVSILLWLGDKKKHVAPAALCLASSNAPAPPFLLSSHISALHRINLPAPLPLWVGLADSILLHGNVSGMSALQLILEGNPLECDSRVQWFQDGAAAGWLHLILPQCVNLPGRTAVDVTLPFYATGKQRSCQVLCIQGMSVLIPSYITFCPHSERKGRFVSPHLNKNGFKEGPTLWKGFQPTQLFFQRFAKLWVRMLFPLIPSRLTLFISVTVTPVSKICTKFSCCLAWFFSISFSATEFLFVVANSVVLRCDEMNECSITSRNCSLCALGDIISCVCNPGYHSNETHCINTNECSEPTQHNCSANADCIDTLGSYQCKCHTGYTGSGQICENIDECNQGLDSCSVHARCLDTIGSYTCTCIEGFTISEKSCVNVDECETGDNMCSPFADCNDTEGSYFCTCKHGFVGNGENCSPVIVCGIGTYLSQDGSCTPCPLNSYNDREESVLQQCFPCPPGYVTDAAGSVSNLQCMCTFWLMFSWIAFFAIFKVSTFLFVWMFLSSVPTHCSPGGYVDTNGNCTQCPDGTFQPKASQVIRGKFFREKQSKKNKQ